MNTAIKRERTAIRKLRTITACMLPLAVAPSATMRASAAEGEPYVEMLAGLRAEITAKLPKIEEAQRKAVEEAKDSKARVAAVNKIAALEPLLASDALDAKLVKHFILHEATPAALAAYAGQGAAHQQRIDELLSNDALMCQIAIADGGRPVQSPKSAPHYGRIMELYEAVQKSSPKAKEGILQRLALATSLEFSDAEDGDSGDSTKALKRYQHYEKAYLGGELDPSFDRLTVWELRFVVSAKESNETLAWGREMLRNFRPDHITTENEAGRYANVVGTDVRYGSIDVHKDRPDQSGMQNILMNGGICGRRAFFARFICRAFGIPATARPSSGHGATARWTPKGWVVVLGPPWRHGWTSTRYRNDLDFLSTTQARARGKDFLKVKRAYWIADVAGEKRSYAESDDNRKPAFWNGVALATQRRLIQESNAVTLDAFGAELGEADGKSVAQTIAASEIGPEAREIIRGADGSITIPAAAFTVTAENPESVIPMKSFSGGLQVYLPRFVRQQPLLVRGGTYKHEATLCDSATRHWKGRRPKNSYHMRGLRLAVTPSGDERPKELTLELNDEVSMDFVYIPPGTFIMGGDRKEISKDRVALADTPKHEVTLTQGFYLGKHEVTQAQYAAVMDREQGKAGKGPDFPVDGVKPSRALQLCDDLSSKTGLEVRLPTEAEWEYAARAGTTSRWHFGDDASKLGDYAWFKGNAGDKTHPVGQKKPNPWGLHDMYGNIAEFVSDEHSEDYYTNSPKVDPTGPLLGTYSDMQLTLEVEQAGNYNLTSQVVTTNVEQSLQLSVNGEKTPTTIALPYTIGAWDESKPVTVTLQQGKNTLHFWRDRAPQFGMALKSFTLKPARP